MASTIDRRPFSQLAILSFSTEFDLGDVGEADGGAVAPGDDQQLVEIGARQRAGGAQNEGLVGTSSVPSGLLELAAASAARTSSTAMPLVASASGSKRTRTAYFAP